MQPPLKSRRIRIRGGIPRIDRSHPLAQGLVGCFLPGVAAGTNFAGGSPLTQGPGFKWSSTLEGAASLSNTTSSNSGLIGTAPPSFKNSTGASVFWRGTPIGGELNSGTPLVGVSYSNDGSQPYWAYFVGCHSDWSSIFAFWNTDGSNYTFSGDTDVSSSYGKMLDIGASFDPTANAIVYTDGVARTTTSMGGNGSLNFGGTPLAVVSQSAPSSDNKSNNAKTNIGLFYNRILTASEFAQLHNDPYCFLIFPEDEMFETKVGAGLVNKTLVAGAGSYAFTGTVATIKHAWKPAASAGSYAFTGTAATLRRNVPVVAGAGSYAFTGTAATIRHAYKITAAAGSYAFTGTDATLTKAGNKTLAAGAGSYTFTGTAATVRHDYKVAAGAGSYAFTGSAAIIRRSWIIVGIDAVISTSSGDVTLNEPAGVQAGDLLVASLTRRGNAAITLPAGWALAAPSLDNGNLTVADPASAASGTLAYIVRGASAPDLVFNRTGANLVIGSIVAYRFPNSDGKVATLGGGNSQDGVSGTTVAVSSLTTTSDDALVVGAAFVGRSASLTSISSSGDTPSSSTNFGTNPTNNVWLRRLDTATTSGEDGLLSVVDSLQPTQAIGSMTFTVSATSVHSAAVAWFYPLGSGAKSLVAGVGTYTFTGIAASVLHAWKLAAGVGSYALTGTAATLRRNVPVVAGAGSYAFTGTAASLLHKWRVTAGAGSYAFTGTDATITKVTTKTVVAGAGSYAFTGTAATLRRNVPVVAGVGSYSFTGTAATLRRNVPVVAGVGSYAFTGTAASILHKWKLTAAAGSYAFTGTAASLSKFKKIDAGVGSYTFTGTAASVLHKWKLTAAASSYAFTGTAAFLNKGKTLVAGAGSYAFTGTAASLLHKKRPTAGVGSYVFTGSAATLRRNAPLVAGAGSYALSGSPASIFYNKKVQAGAGSYIIVGSPINLLISSFNTVTPEERTIYVEYEDRVLYVSAEDRVVYVN